MASENGNGSRMMRNPLVAGVMDEVDVRIARLLGGIDDAAERIAESAQQVEAEIARDERVIRKFNASSGGGTTTIQDMGMSAQLGTALVIDQITFSTSAPGITSAALYLDDPQCADPGNIIFGGIDGFGASQFSRQTNMYIPAGRNLSARMVTNAGSFVHTCVLFGRILSIEP